ncbi:MAG: transcriptional regulator [Candidatus Omnitrophota bacterium]
MTNDIDRLIHEPARLKIICLLSGVEWADFVSLRLALELTQGNLSVHIARLQEAGYVQIKKKIVEKTTHTTYRITKKGRLALAHYWKCLDDIRILSES